MERPITLLSFSFKKGLPAEADMVFDVRFLQNPFYIEALSLRTGLDDEVGKYIQSDPAFDTFFTALTNLLVPVLSRYPEKERHPMLAIGCTGGQHRSVYTAAKLAGFLRELGYKVELTHRDMKELA